jgi:hypothetical protein
MSAEVGAHVENLQEAGTVGTLEIGGARLDGSLHLQTCNGLFWPTGNTWAARFRAIQCLHAHLSRHLVQSNRKRFLATVCLASINMLIDENCSSGRHKVAERCKPRGFSIRAINRTAKFTPTLGSQTSSHIDKRSALLGATSNDGWECHSPR